MQRANLRLGFKETVDIGKEKRPASTEDIFAAPILEVEALRAGISRSVDPGTAIAAGNQAILAKKKRTILYKNGYTSPGTAVALLAAEAVSGIKHSSKLGNNIRKADPGRKRPSETDVHHVVAAEASGAHVSRMMTFAVGIGINDPENGVLLPRYKTTKIASMPNASPHQHIHTDMYYANVVTELVSADDKSDPTEIRGILRFISRRLVQGQFVYC